MRAILIAFAPPPLRGRGFSTAGGRELGLEARPPARFISLSITQKHIKTMKPKCESRKPSDPFGVFFP